MSEKKLCPYCLGALEGENSVCPHCGRSLENSNPLGALPLGMVLAERYTVGEMLAIDGEGIFYRGAENEGAFPVTIKEYLPVTLTAERGADLFLRPKPGCEVPFKTTRMDFADLYRSLRQIAPMTGLETVLDVFEANNTVYAVMENPGGKPLGRWLLEHGKTITSAQASEMLRPIFQGVNAMHQVGLVHRGISPENIRVLENGRARLGGYATIGLRTMGSGLKEQLYEGYAAPEQYSGVDFEGRYTDEYALAAVYYLLVCGQSPVPAGQRLVSDSNPNARTVNRSIPGYISDVLALGLRLKPAERIQTVPKLMQALASSENAAELIRSMKNAQKAEEAQRREKPEEKKQIFSLKALLAAILILLTVLVLLTLWNMLQRQPQPAPEVDVPPVEIEAPEEPEYLPNFIGLTYAQVQGNREYTAKYLFYVTEEYHDSAPEGTIIEQRPAAGEILEKNAEPIRLVVSKGPEMAEMPDILGFTQEGAIRELERRGLVPSCFMVINDGTYASGCVVMCSEEAGARLETGTVVAVYIAAEKDVQVVVTPEQPEQEQEPESEPEEAEPSGEVHVTLIHPSGAESTTVSGSTDSTNKSREWLKRLFS